MPLTAMCKSHFSVQDLVFAQDAETAGGGGYGDPARRTREQVSADLADGKISREGAASYGVTPSPEAT